MKALVLKELKAPLSFEEIEATEAASDEVFVPIRAAALNHRDLWITRGLYPGIVLPTVLGSDGVAEWQGDEYVLNPNLYWGEDERMQADNYQILGLETRGTLASHIVIPRDRLHRKPLHLSKEEAAALPLAGLTAFRALFNPAKGDLKAGQNVLITGIGGGVALMALQFALASAASVYVTSSKDEKIDRAIRMGAHGGANYMNTDWSRHLKKKAGGFDLIIDGAGGVGFNDLVRVLGKGGRIVFYGATAGSWHEIEAARLFLKQATLAGSTMGSDWEFVKMLDFVEQHQIRPVISQVLPLSQGNEALEVMRAGKQFGKLVLIPG